ncbi:MAG: preprotein translocase subunit SecB [Bacteroidota bacterium]|nr:preprotein translocase subunit SecB [Bacteroidota bacterium]MDP4226429.1 preprotein translocase subunit SecB [Bacteroidota bacterium]MDP4274240.1 preprotein translocase subunit SecB [Bacteroidota bacterium]
MIAKESPLILNNFFLLNHQFQSLQPAEITDIKKITGQYVVEIDFAIRPIDQEYYQLFTKIGVNNIEKPLPGYRIYIEGVCIFSFDKNISLSETEKSSLLHFSGINICINSLRNIIANITANSLIGKYTLPVIDVNQLLADKNRINEKK